MYGTHHEHHRGLAAFLVPCFVPGCPFYSPPCPGPYIAFQLCITTVMEGGGVWVEPGIVGNTPESSHDPSPNALYCQSTFLYTLQGEHQVLLATVRHSTFTPSIRVVSLIALTYIFRPRPREAVLGHPTCHGHRRKHPKFKSTIGPCPTPGTWGSNPAAACLGTHDGDGSGPRLVAEALFPSRFMNAWPSRASKPDPWLDPSRNAT